MRIVNTTARDITLNYRTGELVTVPANGYAERPDSDTDYLDDNAATLALFISGQLLLRATGGGAWGGAPLPGTPNQGKLPALAAVVVDEDNQLKRGDDLTSLAGAVRDAAFGAARLNSNQTVSVPSLSRLRISGTGALSIDSMDGAGAVTSAVFTGIYTAALGQIEFPYYGDGAVQIRATFPATLTVEVI